MYFCYICLFDDVMGQGSEYDDMENNAVIAEICCFTNFVNVKWQNKTEKQCRQNRLSYVHCSYIFLFFVSSV